MQAVGRWGNYFNQELYGPPTTLPWGIPIDCAHRLIEYPCALYPEATTRFHPLFLYESISGLIGAAFLIWLGFNARSRLRAGDLFLVFLIWYGTTRFVLETFRVENWTFYGIPVAQIFSLGAILVGIVGLAYRHRRGHPANRPPTYPQNARWGALWPDWMTRPIDEPWANVPASMAAAGAGAGGAADAGGAGGAPGATGAPGSTGAPGPTGKTDWDAIIDADDDDQAPGDDADDVDADDVDADDVDADRGEVDDAALDEGSDAPKAPEAPEPTEGSQPDDRTRPSG
jgi:hypothetical protein